MKTEAYLYVNKATGSKEVSMDFADLARFDRYDLIRANDYSEAQRAGMKIARLVAADVGEAYTEDDHFHVETAMQLGFEPLDDNAEVYGGNTRAFVNLVSAYRQQDKRKIQSLTDKLAHAHRQLAERSTVINNVTESAINCDPSELGAYIKAIILEAVAKRDAPWWRRFIR